MKARMGPDILVGGLGLASQAIRAGLVDEWHLFVAPIVVGGGKRSFPDDVRLQLELVDERPSPTSWFASTTAPASELA